MYSYRYDPETGGLLLNYQPTGTSKEPRPVYAPELDLLGFDQYWNYDKQEELPYMWAEANQYWYRGRRVASLKGGNLYTAPEIILPRDDEGKVIEPETGGKELRPVDLGAMVRANKEIMAVIEESTRKKILQIYKKFRQKLDCFYVAFSGGKDSIVLLDLVKKTLPQESFIVLFADTGMEFPDTYDLIEKIQQECMAENIPFHIARSHLEPEESWRLFGPPSRALRWCCSVHKSSPQILKLRDILKKDNFTGLGFVGVRSHESASRSKYLHENFGIKQEGQHHYNPILEWTSGEIWLYIYMYILQINEAYKKGNSRAGCLLCPMSVNKADFFKYQIYQQQIDPFVNIIKDLNGRNYGDESYITDGGWVSRRSGRDLKINMDHYSESVDNGVLTISVSSPKSDWKQWIKTLSTYSIPLKVESKNSGYDVRVAESFIKENPTLGKLIKQVFRKATFCSQCGFCAANCKNSHLSTNGQVIITDCDNCLMCHNIEEGCLVYSSLKKPMKEHSMSINCFDSALPKNDWFIKFFQQKDDFVTDMELLGPNQIRVFRRFLRDSGLTKSNKFSSVANVIEGLGWDTPSSWAILLTNLADTNPQFQFYIVNLEIDRPYSDEEMDLILSEYTSSKNIKRFVRNAFKKLIELPLGTSLGFGQVTGAGELVRTKCRINDVRVVLYALFKFAESCGDYKEFTLSILLNDDIERDGLSPTRIFGISRDEMKAYLQGLSAKYPEFIHASFTHDLEKIALSKDHSSEDVLELFRREEV